MNMLQFFAGPMGGGISFQTYWTKQISDWQNAGTDVKVSGKPTAEQGGGYNSMPSYADIMDHDVTILYSPFAIRQNCKINSFSLLVFAFSGAAWEFKIMRWSVALAGFECIFSEAFTPSGTANEIKTFNLSTPVDVLEGDVPAIHFPVGNNRTVNNMDKSYGTARTVPLAKAITGNIAVGESNAFTVSTKDLWAASGVGDSFPCVNCYSNRPYFLFLGDSVISSGNGPQDGTEWRTDQENVDEYRTPGGNPGDINYSLAYRLATRMPSLLQYQLLSQGGSMFSNIVAVQGPRGVEIDAHTIVIHSGYNDLFVGSRLWAAIEADLDSLVTMYAGKEIIITDVLPTVGQSDVDVAQIRGLNTNLKNYCTTNGIIFIEAHDQMGVLRETTGELDDLNPIYSNGDTVHLSLAGVDKLADIIAAYFHL